MSQNQKHFYGFEVCSVGKMVGKKKTLPTLQNTCKIWELGSTTDFWSKRIFFLADKYRVKTIPKPKFLGNWEREIINWDF